MFWIYVTKIGVQSWQNTVGGLVSFQKTCSENKQKSDFRDMIIYDFYGDESYDC